MNLSVTGHHLVVTPGLLEYVMSRLNRLKSRLEDSTRVVVRFAGKRKNGWAQSIHISINLPGKVIVIREFLRREIGDFYTSVNKAVGMLAEKLDRHAHTQDKTHRSARTVVRSNKYTAAAV